MADRLDDWKSVREDIFIDDPQHELALEEFRNGQQQMVFIHLWVKKDWSKKLLKQFAAEWKVLRKHVTGPLFACVRKEDDKWRKFISLFGFKPFTEAIWSDGSRRQIYLAQGTGDEQFKTNHQFKSKHKLELDHEHRPGSIPTAVSTGGVRGSDRRAEHSAGERL